MSMSGLSGIRVYLRPTGLHSRAMVRVVNALERYMPTGVVIASSPASQYADLSVLHVIGRDAIDYTAELRAQGQRYVVFQYCLQTTGATIDEWLPVWRGADLVASYYDLRDLSSQHGFNFYHCPLGLDDVFTALPDTPDTRVDRQRLVVTTGYVHGSCAEAIQEAWQAAEIAGIDAVHVGPSKVEGISEADYPPRWYAVEGLSDEELSNLYRRASWVAALRHVEGFELPAAEGVACGARPILFDQPALRFWYGRHATYVPDRSGRPLVDDLVRVFSGPALTVSEIDRQDALNRFNWQTIAQGFWDRVLNA